MITSLQSYVRQGQHTLRKWALDPKIHQFLRAAVYFLAGFVLSGASLSHKALPLAMALVCASTGWPAVLTAMGSCCGYLAFWGNAGQQGLLWVGVALAVTLVPGQRLSVPVLLLISALSALIVSASGVIFQIWLADTTSVPVYILRVVLATSSAALFCRVLRERHPILDWLACALGVLALAQLAPIPYLGFGYIAAGILSVSGAFPAAALSGLALDLAQITPLPMTAVLCGSYLVRFLPHSPRWLRCITPASTCFLFIALTAQWDFTPVAGLLLGGTAGCFLPMAAKAIPRRGEVGVAQVRLELAATVLTQAEQLLLEAPTPAVDENALVLRAAERACGNCPCRKTCKDRSNLKQLPSDILHKPLLSPDELPLVCKKNGRFLSELYRSQEQFRAIRADRQRQREYRNAVIQQYRFMSEYLQDLSDQLSRHMDVKTPRYTPDVHIYGNRPESANGDRCTMFSGTLCRYYVLLCDGMGTSLGAVQEAEDAGKMLQRLLSVGYPAEYALRSLNSLCALRNKAGSVTVDLAEIYLDSGKVVLYKWGAAPSYRIFVGGAEKLGIVGPPPGLSVTDCRETAERLSLRRGEILVLVSDGVSESDALRCCLQPDLTMPELAEALLSGEATDQDDATVVTIRLQNEPTV